MGCLFAIFAGAFPRLGTFVIWLARPDLFSDAFSGRWLVPLLGILCLPLTTLMWVLVWATGRGVSGWDWLWVGLGFLLDLSHWAASASAGYQNRDQIPGYSASMTA
jgi:hypothetical protein